MYKTSALEQRTLDWYRARLGVITGSQVGVIMKTGRSKDKPFSDTALNYLYQLAGERSLNPEMVNDDELFSYYIDQTTSQSKAMRFGTEQEENARVMYSSLKGIDVKEVGLCPHPVITCLASSPDGIVDEGGNLGCVEIKCPTLPTFSKYSAEITDNDSLKRVNPDYYYQCQCHMACTEATFCDFVVYCPFVSNPIHIVRIARDEDAIAQMIERAKAAEEVIIAQLEQLNKRA